MPLIENVVMCDLASGPSGDEQFCAFVGGVVLMRVRFVLPMVETVELHPRVEKKGRKTLVCHVDHPCGVLQSRSGLVHAEWDHSPLHQRWSMTLDESSLASVVGYSRRHRKWQSQAEQLVLYV